MNEHNKNVNNETESIEKYQTNYRTEEYDNWTEKYTRIVQQQSGLKQNNLSSFWRKNGWKIPKPGERNQHSDPGITEFQVR